MSVVYIDVSMSYHSCNYIGLIKQLLSYMNLPTVVLMFVFSLHVTYWFLYNFVDNLQECEKVFIHWTYIVLKRKSRYGLWTTTAS